MSRFRTFCPRCDILLRCKSVPGENYFRTDCETPHCGYSGKVVILSIPDTVGEVIITEQG